MILWAIFFLSFSALAFEILLARLFSISQWHHLSFMVISVALLGFASGGVLFSIIGSRWPGWEKRLSSPGCLDAFLFSYAVTTLFALFVLCRIHLDYFRLPLEPIQALYLLILYLVLSLPFFFAGLSVMIGYAAFPEKSGWVYSASMTGSACGAFVSIPMLPIFGEIGAATVAALIPLAPAAIGAIGALWRKIGSVSDHRRPRARAVGSLLIAGLIAGAAYPVFLSQPPLVQIRPSPYKALTQSLQLPDTRKIFEATSIYGRIDLLESPHFRNAPGMSLKFLSKLPRQWTAFRDGDHPFTLYETCTDCLTFSRDTLQYAGYLSVRPPGRVLIIQSGGGTAIPCALASGATDITVVELNPHLARLTREHYRVRVVSDTPRALLARSGMPFDIIHVENWGPSLPGIGALNQEYMLTVEAFVDALNRLADHGILIASRKLRLPPGDSIRLWSTAHDALARRGAISPGRHILMLRNWDTFTLIVSKVVLSDLKPFIDFANRFNFDFIISDPAVSDLVNRHNRFPEPYYHRMLSNLAAAYSTGTQEVFFEDYLLDARPRTDGRPFSDRFLKWSRVRSLYESTGSRFYTLFMSGEVIVAVIFLEALALCVLLLWVPTFSSVGANLKISSSRFFYFLFIGSGFMFFEMGILQAYALLFGDPVLSFTVVITGVLLISGAGGMLAQRLEQRTIQTTLMLLIALLIAGFFFADAVLHGILKTPTGIRVVLAFIVIVPIGVPAGFPFALGMRYLLIASHERAFAWAANGCASVLAAVAAVQIALSLGIYANFLFAAMFYGAAWLCAEKRLP